MKKKLVFVILLLVVMCAVFVGCNKTGISDSVVNGGFENISETDNIVTDWTKSKSGSFTFAPNENDGSDDYNPNLGRRYATVSGGTATDEFDHLYTSVKLKSGRYYRLSALVNVENITPQQQVGAKVSFKNAAAFEGINIIEKTSGWETREIYFQAATSKEMLLYVGLGDSKNQPSGTVSFDNIVLEEVNNVPQDYQGSVVRLQHIDSYTLSDGGSTTFVVLFAIISILICIIAYFVLRMIFAKKEATIQPLGGGGKSGFVAAMTGTVAKFSYLLAIAFLVRFFIVIFCYGMGSNITSLSEIGVMVTNNSFMSLLSGTTPVNQTSGVTIIMGLFGMIANALNMDYGSMGFAILVRIPSIIAEMIIVFLIYSYALKHQDEKQALVFGGLYAILPIFFIFGSMYASIQPIAICFLVAMCMAMLDKKYILTGCMFTLALIFSNLAILALPAVLVYQVMAIVKQKEQRIAIILSMVCCLIVFLAISMPLCWSEFRKGNIFYYIKVMYNTFKAVSFVSVDTFNIYGLFGAANTQSVDLIFEILTWLVMIALAGIQIYHYVKTNNRLDLIFTTALMFISYSVLGAGVTLDILPIGLVLMLLYLVNMPENRLSAVFGGFSCLSFINVAAIIAHGGFIVGGSGASYLPFAPTSAIMIVFSLFTVAVFVYLIYLAIDILFYEHQSTIQPLERSLKQELKYIFTFEWLKKRKKRVE